MSDETPDQPRYGSTWVGGHAVVHQGDVVNYISVESAFFESIDGVIRFEEGNTCRSRKRLHEETHCGPRKRVRVAQEDTSTQLDLPTLSRSTEYVRWLQAPATSPTETEHENAAKKILSGLLVGLFDTLGIRWARIAGGGADHDPTSPTILSQSAPLVRTQKLSDMDLLLLCFILAAFVAGRHSTADKTSSFLMRCYQDKVTPVFALVLGMTLYRHLYLGTPLDRPSVTGGNYILFEDVFGEEKMLSMSVCTHSSVFKTFLKTYYKAGPGEQFIRTEQFNFALGARRGHLLRADDWSDNGHVRPKTRIIMSFYLVTTLLRCAICSSIVVLDPCFNEYHCSGCKRTYRRCDGRDRDSPFEHSQKEMTHDHVNRVSTQDYEMDRYDTGLDDNKTYELDVFQNLDLQLVTPQEMAKHRSSYAPDLGDVDTLF